jgi:hypothetical protein
VRARVTPAILGDSGGGERGLVAAELGVASGAFSSALLDAGVDELYSIDAWRDHDRAHTALEYFSVVSALRRFGPRSVVLRATFDEALAFFPGLPFASQPPAWRPVPHAPCAASFLCASCPHCRTRPPLLPVPRAPFAVSAHLPPCPATCARLLASSSPSILASWHPV